MAVQELPFRLVGTAEEQTKNLMLKHWLPAPPRLPVSPSFCSGDFATRQFWNAHCDDEFKDLKESSQGLLKRVRELAGIVAPSAVSPLIFTENLKRLMRCYANDPTLIEGLKKEEKAFDQTLQNSAFTLECFIDDLNNLLLLENASEDAFFSITEYPSFYKEKLPTQDFQLSIRKFVRATSQSHSRISSCVKFFFEKIPDIKKYNSLPLPFTIVRKDQQVSSGMGVPKLSVVAASAFRSLLNNPLKVLCLILLAQCVVVAATTALEPTHHHFQNRAAGGSEFKLTDGERSNALVGLNNGNWMSIYGQPEGGQSSFYDLYGQVYDGKKKVGGAFSITTSPDNQDVPAGATLANGNVAAVWVSEGEDGSGKGVYGIIVDSSGKVIVSQFLVNSDTSGNEDLPTIAALQNGGFIVAWQSDKTGRNRVYGQIFTSTAIKIGEEIDLVNPLDPDSGSAPTVAQAPNNEALVAWVEGTGKVGRENDIRAQRVNATGGLVSRNFLIAGSGSETESHPKVAYLTDGNVAVVWQKEIVTTDDVFGAIYNSSFIRNDLGRINTVTTEEQRRPEMAALDNGRFITVWTSLNQVPSPARNNEDIFAQIFFNGGSRDGGEFLVNDATVGVQWRHRVAALQGGGFVVSWIDTTKEAIFAKVFSESQGGTTTSSAASFLPTQLFMIPLALLIAKGLVPKLVGSDD